MFHLTEHFSPFEENVGQPARHGFKAEPYPVDWYPRLSNLFQQLEVLREVWNVPIHFLSVYRTVEYNDYIYISEGKTPTHSQHCLGRAADIVVLGVDAAEVHAAALRLFKAGYLRIGGLGSYPKFTHIDTRPVGDHLAQWNGLHTAGAMVG